MSVANTYSFSSSTTATTTSRPCNNMSYGLCYLPLQCYYWRIFSISSCDQYKETVFHFPAKTTHLSRQLHHQHHKSLQHQHPNAVHRTLIFPYLCRESPGWQPLNYRKLKVLKWKERTITRLILFVFHWLVHIFNLILRIDF